MVLQKYIKKRKYPYSFRPTLEEERTLESLRIEWQFPSISKVLHKLIGMARFLQDKVSIELKKMEDVKKTYKL